MLMQLLDFINNLSIDEKLYWRVANAKSKTDGFEITWRRSDRPKPWYLRNKHAESGQAYDTGEFAQALALAGVDLEDFERQLGVSILTQAVFADLVMQSAVQLFGSEVVHRSIQDTRAFMSQVSQLAQMHTGNNQEPRQGAMKQRPRLRIVSDKLH